MQLNRKAPIKSTVIAIISFLIIYAICVLWLDRPLAYWIQATFHDSTTLCNIGIWVQEKLKPTHWFGVGIIVAIVGIILGFRKSEHARAWLLVGGSIIVAFILCGILKLLVGRYRPDDLFLHGLYGFHSLEIRNDSGSPSGHTTLAFAALWALAMAWNKRWLFVILFIVAALVGIFRLVVDAHYLGDVIFGGYLGILSVYWVRWALSYCSRLSKCAEHKTIDG